MYVEIQRRKVLFVIAINDNYLLLKGKKIIFKKVCIFFDFCFDIRYYQRATKQIK